MKTKQFERMLMSIGAEKGMEKLQNECQELMVESLVYHLAGKYKKELLTLCQVHHKLEAMELLSNYVVDNK